MSSELHKRLNHIAGDESFRLIGERTDHNQETARRYMKGQSPSVEFIAAFCKAYDVNETWLLTGRGTVRASDVRRYQLSQSNPTELLTAVADALERLIERVDRIEAFIHTMEARLRVRGVDAPTDQERTDGKTGPQNPTSHVVTRAGRVADGLSERAPQDAD